jgi:protocatechuate 3,4-dioxygenase, alpha subunit
MDQAPCPSQTVGPYFHLGCADPRWLSCPAGPKAKGERVRLVCRVLDGEGVPVTDAMIEIWQADWEGKYHHPEDPRAKAGDPDCPGFARSATDERGISVFDTIRPGRVPGNNGSWQAPHLNVSLFARGVMKRLATRIYFAEDPANPQDPVLALVPEERRKTLMAKPDPQPGGHWRFDLRLCGEEETVFFDV